MAKTFWKGRLGAPLLLSLIWSPALSAPPELQLPLICTLGEDCYVQQYVDRQAGDGVQDFGCGAMANDGHKGTDFGVPTLSHMARGVPVIAAAAGVVRGARDGMPDVDASTPQTPDLSNRECGNGVAITHSDGWETQYCHLKQGSVRVEIGDAVEAGTPLGEVGMSGLASFPHLHFVVRRGNEVIDPFRPDMSVGCGLDAVPDMWIEATAYRPGGLLEIGVIDRVPDYDEVKAGLSEVALPEAAPSALVLWGFLYAGKAGDTVELSLSGPQGTLGKEIVTLEKVQPFLYRAWGKRAPADGFPAGAYKGEVVHRRGADELDRRSVSFSLP